MTQVSVSEDLMTSSPRRLNTPELRFGWVTPNDHVLEEIVNFCASGSSKLSFPQADGLPILVHPDPLAYHGYSVRHGGRNELHVSKQPLGGIEQELTIDDTHIAVARVPVMPHADVRYHQIHNIYLQQEVERLTRVATHFKDGVHRAAHETRRISRRAEDAETSASMAIAQVQKNRFDPVTRLLNSIAFNKDIVGIVESFMQANLPFSVWYADMDGLKRHNDNYGHDHGDRVLRGVADSMVRYFNRGGEVVYRRGLDKADELVGISPEICDGALQKTKSVIQEDVDSLRFPNPRYGTTSWPDGSPLYSPGQEFLQARLSIGVAIFNPSYFLANPKHPEYHLLSRVEMFNKIAHHAEILAKREKKCTSNPNEEIDALTQRYDTYMASQGMMGSSLPDSSTFKLRVPP